MFVIKPDTGAGTDGAIAENRSNIDSCTAVVKLVANFPLETSKIALASVLSMYLPLLVGLADKGHEVVVLLIRQL